MAQSFSASFNESDDLNSVDRRLTDSDDSSVSGINSERVGTAFDLDVDNLANHFGDLSTHDILGRKIDELTSAVYTQKEAMWRFKTKVQEEMSKLSKTQHHQLDVFDCLNNSFRQNRAALEDITLKVRSVAERIEQVEEHELGGIVTQLEGVQNKLDQTADIGEIDRVLNNGELLSFVIVLYGSCGTHQTNLLNY